MPDGSPLEYFYFRSFPVQKVISHKTAPAYVDVSKSDVTLQFMISIFEADKRGDAKTKMEYPFLCKDLTFKSSDAV